MRISIATLFFCLLVSSSYAQLSAAKLFSEHMVVQRDKEVPVWGWAKKKASVTVIMNGQSVSVKADDEGYWKAVLKAMPAGGPFIMNVASGKELLAFKDVMIGEVWICGGQSNMEFQLKNAYGYKFEQQHSAQYPIRQFTVAHKLSLSPEREVAGGQWAKADTNTVGDFTAVGYFFAKKLSQQLHVTVGLIYSNWGGTLAEDWISHDALMASPELGAAAKELPTTWDGVKLRIDKQLKEYVYKNKPVINYTVEGLAAQPSSFFSDWQTGNAPGAWEWMGKLYSYRGEGFMQRTIKLDSFYNNRNSVIRLGTTDADLALYINGKLIKKGALPNPYQLDLPKGTWKAGDNSVLIQLLSQQKNPSWFGMGLNGTGNDINVQFPDTTINMADNNWRTMPDLSKPYHFDFLPNNNASDLYNGMINPLIPYAIAGVIWYQGESNADKAFQYRSTFTTLITDWRSKWKEQLPFLFVQLSSFGGMQNSNTGSQWAELREAQAMALQLPNTGMAMTYDIGDAFNIHPKDKADVGLRLAASALNTVYHQPNSGASPMFSSVDFKDNYAIIKFTNAGKGLVARDKYGYLKGFEIAGSDHIFYYAQATITADNQVQVSSRLVAKPIAVRYAWTDAPLEANLFSADGFPASPFRTDNWKMITEGKKFE